MVNEINKLNQIRDAVAETPHVFSRGFVKYGGRIFAFLSSAQNQLGWVDLLGTTPYSDIETAAISDGWVREGGPPKVFVVSTAIFAAGVLGGTAHALNNLAEAIF